MHNSAYEKLLGGEFAAGGSPDEQRAVLELITAGMELWNSVPVIANPCSVIVSDGEQGAPRVS